MITLAMDTATDRCTVAAGDGVRVVASHIDGSRRHAAAIVSLIDTLLRDLGVAPTAIDRVVIGDGPGSFTGLRVAASVAKALTWHRNVEWRIAQCCLTAYCGGHPNSEGHAHCRKCSGYRGGRESRTRQAAD